jgi:hypothetical protein
LIGGSVPGGGSATAVDALSANSAAARLAVQKDFFNFGLRTGVVAWAAAADTLRRALDFPCR